MTELGIAAPAKQPCIGHGYDGEYYQLHGTQNPQEAQHILGMSVTVSYLVYLWWEDSKTVDNPLYGLGSRAG